MHENEKDIYGDTGMRCLEILKACDSPNLRAAFDPARMELAICGRKGGQSIPFLSKLKEIGVHYYSNAYRLFL